MLLVIAAILSLCLAATALAVQERNEAEQTRERKTGHARPLRR